ncbi:glycosyltransferase [Auraticoccus sp. F435]|uniref:Glycosyltransferase n=1 Tax=Auraticoccus cholistanensis TaxID=2656650 RepID=A0A6A9UYW0_9ACTN|nr:glycosyltransferase [Auraticoccus cholistanensis]
MSEQSSPHAPESLDEPAVSVVVPVYNAMPYLRDLMDSLVAQDLPATDFEVVAVDDGSTDDSPAVLDEYAAAHPNVQVVHQPNSGWPGIPRNRGLDLARGRYVFFADADDRMGTEALRRMTAFADQHASDVVVPKMVGVGGRWVRAAMYAETQVDADLENVFTTLTPQKLFRRSFLLEHQIRFPEEKVRLEDGMMLARAYLTARRVSLLGDYDYYYLVARDDGKNISSQGFDPAGYTWSIGEVSRIIKELDPDQARADRIVLDLYRRKCLKFYEPERYWKMPDARRDAFLVEHRKHIETFITPEMEARLNRKARRRSQLIRAGDKAGLVALAADGVDHRPHLAELESAEWSWRGLRLRLRVSGGVPSATQAVELYLQDREGTRTATLVLDKDEVMARALGRLTVWQASVLVPSRLLRRDGEVVLDASVGLRDGQPGQRVRVQVAEHARLPAPRRGARPYATIKDNFSIELNGAR